MTSVHLGNFSSHGSICISLIWCSLSENDFLLVLCIIKSTMILERRSSGIFWDHSLVSILSRNQIWITICVLPQKELLEIQQDDTAMVSFAWIWKSWIMTFSYWLFKAHFTSRRDNWQTIIHVISDKMANIIKNVVLGPHLEKESTNGLD